MLDGEGSCRDLDVEIDMLLILMARHKCLIYETNPSEFSFIYLLGF